jgi:hypothetical protein
MPFMVANYLAVREKLGDIHDKVKSKDRRSSPVVFFLKGRF